MDCAAQMSLVAVRCVGRHNHRIKDEPFNEMMFK